MSLNTSSLQVVEKKPNLGRGIYYKKSDCKFLLCGSCFWCTTLLYDEHNTNIKICPMCKRKKLYNTLDTFELFNLKYKK